jgi:hypothetical protein
MSSRIAICTFLAGAASLGAAVVLGSTAASAEEQTLKFRLLTRSVQEAAFEQGDVPGQFVSASEQVGVAIFEDGRIAYKEFVNTTDGTADAGTFLGYSTYTFENGDSITARFTGAWSANGEGGDYEVLSGTGAYSGVTGTGRFDAVGESWDKANLYEGSFTLDVPSS